MSTLDWLVAKPIAHRGLHDRAHGIIENSITAADAAIAGGFAIECDVQLTSDDEAVVFHDFDLERLTGQTGDVRARKASELTGAALTGSKSDSIPLLSAFLGRIGGRVPLIVEIKSRYDGNMALTRRTCELLAGYSGPAVIKSFDPTIVAEVRRIAPNIPRGIVAESNHTDKGYGSLSAEQRHALGNLLHFAESQPQFISWHVKDLPTAAPFLTRLLGHLPVMAWTVRTPEDRERAAKYADQMVFEGFVP
jgi:glycerophosphoryl diester phosphodiesterase